VYKIINERRCGWWKRLKLLRKVWGVSMGVAEEERDK
jgi:hypothetical protein